MDWLITNERDDSLRETTSGGVICIKHNVGAVGKDGFGMYCPSCYTEDSNFRDFVDQFRETMKMEQELRES